MENTELDRLIKSSGIFLIPERVKYFGEVFFQIPAFLDFLVNEEIGMCLV